MVHKNFFKNKKKFLTKLNLLLFFSDDRFRGGRRLAAEDRTVGEAGPSRIPWVSISVPASPQPASGPLIVLQGCSLMLHNEAEKAPWWHDAGDFSVVTSPVSPPHENTPQLCGLFVCLDSLPKVRNNNKTSTRWLI